MKINEFIVKNGIEELNGKQAINNGIIVTIDLSEYDLEFFDKSEDEYVRSEKFIMNAHYRFMATWKSFYGRNCACFVYPDAELLNS
jgi:hypothetical protein